MKLNLRGGKLSAQEFDRIKATFKNAPTVRIGVPQGAGRYKDGVHTATVAAVHEFGSADGRVPERSFLRATLNNMRDLILKLYRKRFADVIDGGLSMTHVQGEVGQLMEGAVTEYISTSIPPPNSKKTIAKKKSDTTLIDTGHLKQSIRYTLVKKGAQ